MGRTQPHQDEDSRKMLVVGMALSFVLHGVLAAWILTMEPIQKESTTLVEMAVVDRPTPKPPKPELSPPTPPPSPKVRPATAVTRPPERVVPRTEPTKPPPTLAPPPVATGGAKSFGIRLENTVQAAPGTGVAVPTGETLQADPNAPRPRRPGTGDAGSGQGDGAPEPVTTRLAAVKTLPKLLSDSVAAYPLDVRRLGIQGRVVLELVVDEAGHVARSRVVKSLHPRLDEAAVAASKGLRFSPATVDGQPTTVKIPYNYVFVLD